MNQIRVLIVDDDDLFLKSLEKELTRMGYTVRTASDARRALSELKSSPPDVILLDIRLPDQDGLDLLRAIKRRDASVEVIMLTAYATVDTAVKSLQAGAYHYLVKPSKLTEINALIQKAYEKRGLRIENQVLREKLLRGGQDEIIGPGAKMSEVLKLVERVAPTNQTILIQGESGTGKELVARRLHRLSQRSDRPFVVVDCASLSKNLLESELFGHEKGAFTGAVAVKHGLIEAAHTGTLFVDEIGSLEPEMQSDFLRLLESREYRRIGATSMRKADVRIVAATNVDLAEAVRQGKFREDLFFRLSVIMVAIPPLRERREDIPSLAEHFLAKAQIDGCPKKLSPRALEELTRHNWPGNIRELRNVIERASLLSEGEVIEPWDFRILSSPADRIIQKLLDENDLIPLRELQSRYIHLVLRRVHGHQQKAADILGIDPKTIYRQLRRKAEESEV